MDGEQNSDMARQCSLDSDGPKPPSTIRHRNKKTINNNRCSVIICSSRLPSPLPHKPQTHPASPHLRSSTSSCYFSLQSVCKRAHPHTAARKPTDPPNGSAPWPLLILPSWLTSHPSLMARNRKNESRWVSLKRSEESKAKPQETFYKKRNCSTCQVPPPPKNLIHPHPYLGISPAVGPSCACVPLCSCMCVCSQGRQKPGNKYFLLSLFGS